MELLSSVSLTVVAFLFVLGVMIFVHELGHYLMAKSLGIRIEVFSLGFGPRLLGFRRGGTDYRISALPLGGYVKMAGESYEEELTGSPEEFLSRPKIHRFWVAVAGPLMNLGLAVVLLSINYLVGIQVPSYLNQPAVIGKIDKGSPAVEAGLQLKDKIVAIDGEASPTWQSVEIAIGTSPNRTLTLTLERAGQIVSRRVTTSVQKRREVGTIGVHPFIPYLISQVEPESPAAQAGLKPGDKIVQVNTSEATAFGFYDIPEVIASQEGQPVGFQVRRNFQIFHRTIVPVKMGEQVRIGIVMNPLITVKYGLFEAVIESVKHNYELTVLTLAIVGKIVSGRTSWRALSGPIEIARFSGRAASMGIVPLMALMSLISLNLGILNLLPIPVLDGGVIAVMAVEGLIRRDLSLRVKELISQVGFILLILLMGAVLVKDVYQNLPIL